MPLTYQEARSQIVDGDLVAVITPHNFLGVLTKFFTRRPYTHTGTAIWIDEGLYMGELNGGRNHLIPLSQLKDVDFDVYFPPAGVKPVSIRAAIFKWLRHPIDYGCFAFVAIGLLDYLNIKVFVRLRKLLVCSGWCIEVYDEAGWGKHSVIESPGDLTDMLTLKFQVRHK